MNIIFLDIDGVLNNRATIWFTTNCIDTNCLSLFLETIKEIPECKIVLSSSWRNENKAKFKELIRHTQAYLLYRLFPFFHADYCTPKLKGIRGLEIKQWLDCHQEDVHKYLCIDDDTDYLPEQPLLQINRHTGFSFIDTFAVRNHFGLLTDREKENYESFLVYENSVLKNHEKLRKSC